MARKVKATEVENEEEVKEVVSVDVSAEESTEPVTVTVDSEETLPEEPEETEAMEAPAPVLSEEEAEAVVSGEVELLMHTLPEKIHGKKVVSVEHYNGLHHIKDEERTTYSLPDAEYNLWSQGKAFVGV